MKSIMLAAALALLVGLSTSSVVNNPCDKNDRCTALSSVSPLPRDALNASEVQDAKTVAPRHPQDANGNNAIRIVKSRKTGALARVGAIYAARFQAYIDDLETNYGARVLFMGGTRPGRCSRSSQHPCGKALDVCQLRRGVVDPRCKLPGPITLAEVAAAHGLFEGGRWCNSDYGHAQVGVTAGACGNRRVRTEPQRTALAPEARIAPPTMSAIGP
jgi:hypothetical protein